MNNINLPKGFENNEFSEAKFKDAKPSSPGGTPMRRGPGGPGAMGRAIEKPKDIKKTLLILRWISERVNIQTCSTSRWKLPWQL